MNLYLWVNLIFLNFKYWSDPSFPIFKWTIISLSKKEGAISKKQEQSLNKQNLFSKAKKSEVYKKVSKFFPDAELINVNLKEDKKDEWFQ